MKLHFATLQGFDLKALASFDQKDDTAANALQHKLRQADVRGVQRRTRHSRTTMRREPDGANH